SKPSLVFHRCSLGNILSIHYWVNIYLTHTNKRRIFNSWTHLERFNKPSFTSPIRNALSSTLLSCAGREGRSLVHGAAKPSTLSSRRAAYGFAISARSNSLSRLEPFLKIRLWDSTSG